MNVFSAEYNNSQVNMTRNDACDTGNVYRTTIISHVQGIHNELFQLERESHP